MRADGEKAMGLSAADGVRTADKAVPMVMREMGMRCGIRRRSARLRCGSCEGAVERWSRTSPAGISPPAARG